MKIIYLLILMDSTIILIVTCFCVFLLLGVYLYSIQDTLGINVPPPSGTPSPVPPPSGTSPPLQTNETISFLKKYW